MASGAREADPSSVGMMEGAFFVGRSELLDWVNSLLGTRVSRVEQCASGCIYIQIIDALVNGSYTPSSNKVPMAKVKWSAKYDYEYIYNYKILQSVFNKQKINKHIEVDRLIKAKYQDNLEFLQWIKAFYDRMIHSMHAQQVPYNPIERRRLGMGPFPEWAPIPANYTPSDSKIQLGSKSGSYSGVNKKSVAASKSSPNTSGVSKEHVDNQSGFVEDNEALETQFQQACLERNFYYNKLRRIEILCSGASKDSETIPVKALQAILYATDEDEYSNPDMENSMAE